MSVFTHLLSLSIRLKPSMWSLPVSLGFAAMNAGSSKKSIKIVPHVARWLLHVRAELVADWGQNEAWNYLDIHVECLRNGLLDAYRACHVDESDAGLIMFAIDCLTTLRLGSDSTTEWIGTGFPTKDPRLGCSLPVFTTRNVMAMYMVLHFLTDAVPAELQPISWPQVTAWLTVYMQRFGPEGLYLLD